MSTYRMIKRTNNIEKLHAMGLKSTPLRLGLMEFIFNLDLPQDVGAISTYLTEKNISFDRVSLYRNLEIFVKKGVLKKIDLLDGKYYYEKADDCSHLICQQCGGVEHLHLDSLDSISEKVSKKTGFKVVQQVSDFYGTCKKCR